MRARRITIVLLILAAVACAAPATRPTIASLSPAVTDLLLACGARERLVAVSNYDIDERVSGLPKAGDYLSADWEKLAAAKPGVIVVQMKADRVPPGLREKAAEIGARLEVVQLDRIADVPATIRALAKSIDSGIEAADRFDAMLQRVRERVAHEPRVPVLVVLNSRATFVAGRETFLDDVLTIAGGGNVITQGGYPTIDAERLIALAPTVIVQLLPGASETVRAEAAGRWKAMGDVPAVRDGKVFVLVEPWAMLPGYRQAELCEKLAEILHPRR